MGLIAVMCPYCQRDSISKRGKTETDQHRDRCQTPGCPHPSFRLNPAYNGRLPEIKEQMIDRALSGSGSRDTARVWGIRTGTVMNGLKKKSRHSSWSVSSCEMPDRLAMSQSSSGALAKQNGTRWGHLGCRVTLQTIGALTRVRSILMSTSRQATYPKERAGPSDMTDSNPALNAPDDLLPSIDSDA